MHRLALLAASASVLASAVLQPLHVCCGCGSNSVTATGALAFPFDTLQDALDHLEKAPAQSDEEVVVNIFGKCYQRQTLTLSSEHRRIRFVGVASKDSPAEISGGMPLDASAFTPVTDPAVLTRMAPNAKGNVLQADLTALGIAVPPAPLCRPYEGTDAGILPNGVQPTGLELFWAGDPYSQPGIAAPLELARYPNRAVPPTNWTHISKALDPGVPARAVLDTATAARLAAWQAELARDPTSIAIHYNNPIGWADLHLPIQAINASAGQVTIGPCNVTGVSSWDSIETAAYFYTYNLLPELDEEGEYVIDRVANMLYVWPPSGPSSPIWKYATWGLPVVQPEAAGTTAGAPRPQGTTGPLAVVTPYDGDLLSIVGTSYLSFEGITFGYTRGKALAIVNSTYISFTNCSIVNAGAMAVNITGGSNVTFNGCLIRGAGNGGVYSYSGDRVALTSSGNALISSSVNYNNRYMFCYVPLVALGGVGTSMVSSEVFGQAHMAIFHSGNNHVVQGNSIHDVVQVVRDSGALYTGRDWTYRGTVITGNAFTRIYTDMSGDDVSAVYLDDSASGIIITGNVFTNVSRALLLGGGRDNVFSNNVVNRALGTDAAIHFDNRDQGWAKSACSIDPPGILVEFLGRVPYNTSSTWVSSYPHLPNILNDEPCVPKYNIITGNSLCTTKGLPWIDVDNATIASWGSVEYNNTNTTC